MSVQSSIVGFSRDSFDAFVASRNEPGWLTDLRRDAWNLFEARAWPARNDEEWIRTDIRLFKLDKFSPPADATQVAEATQPLLIEGVELAGRTASIDSRPAATSVDPALAAKGVVFGSLDELVHMNGELVRKYLLNRALDPGYDKFSALHAAFWSGGHFLYVPRGLTVQLPFHLLSALSDGGTDLSHSLVVLDEGAEATVLTETASHGQEDGGLHCGGTEVIQGQGSRLRFVSLQNWGFNVWHFAHQKAIVSRDASLQWTVAAMGGKLSKVNQHVELVGKGAECQVNGVLFAEGKQHISYHTLQHHLASDCRSDFLYKAALQDKSRTVWRGMIKVDAAAQKTDGYQRNDNLLLSATARADSIPGLEIEADDVRCTHGSTTGKVDEELIFYAQARGFTRTEATRMIVTGFFQQIFDRITIDSVRDALGNAISRRVREYL